MKKIIFFIICSLLTIQSVEAKHIYSEKTYQKYWCDKHKGKMEYKLNDGTRVDCLTDKYAVEFDFAKKYHECLGQAQHYSARTGIKGACILIIEDLDEYKYVDRLRKTIYKKKLDVRSFTITPIKLDIEVLEI